MVRVSKLNWYSAMVPLKPLTSAMGTARQGHLAEIDPATLASSSLRVELELKLNRTKKNGRKKEHADVCLVCVSLLITGD